ncbi:hypothetical protein BDZ97DRAFT_1826961, partial [Flammula alnicola]
APSKRQYSACTDRSIPRGLLSLSHLHILVILCDMTLAVSSPVNVMPSWTSVWRGHCWQNPFNILRHSYYCSSCPDRKIIIGTSK